MLKITIVAFGLFVVSCGAAEEEKENAVESVATDTVSPEGEKKAQWFKKLFGGTADEYIFLNGHTKQYKLIITGTYWKDLEGKYVYEESSGTYVFDQTSADSGKLTLNAPEASTCADKPIITLALNAVSETSIKLGNDGDYFDVMDDNTDGDTALEGFKQDNPSAVGGCGYFKSTTILPSGVEVLNP